MADALEGLLNIEVNLVFGAQALPAMDFNGKADPFFKLIFANREIYKSKIIKKTKDPVWNETYKHLITHIERKYSLTIQVYDWDKASKDDYIGMVDIDLSQLEFGTVYDSHLPLVNPKLEKKNGSIGTIHVRITLLDREGVDREFWSSFAKHFDTDGSGSINRVEFGAMIGAIHPSLDEDQINEMFDRADSDHNGDISFEEAYVMFVTDERLTAAVLGTDPNFIWHILAKSDDYHSVGSLVLNKNLVHEQQSTVDKAERKTIMVHCRETKKLVEEKIPLYIEVSLRVMYSRTGRTAVENNQIRKLLHHLSVSQGKKYNDPRSKKEIQHFIEFHNLNTDEILDPIDSFANFNEFFYRKLKPSARPIYEEDNPNVAVSPADCRMLVFPKIEDATEIWIKGKNFTLKNLLDDDELAARFNGGSLVIARLAPQDYHRFHLPVYCTVGPTRSFDGALYTVNPIAIRKPIDVYTENKRCVTVLNKTIFGTVLYVSVGATMVGSIELTTQEGQVCKKGDEQGYFAFGGSTILLLFEPNRIAFKESLIVNSRKPIETLVKMGTKLGVSV